MMDAPHDGQTITYILYVRTPDDVLILARGAGERQEP